MRRFFKGIAACLICVILYGCSNWFDSDNDGELKTGTFKAETTGAIENEFSGEATFIFSISETYEAEYLHLELNAGEIPYSTGMDSISSDYGLFLAAPWDSVGALSFEYSSILSFYHVPNSYMQPDGHGIMHVNNGSIIIKERTANLLTGEIRINQELPPPDSGEIEITASFKAKQWQSEN